MPYQSPTWNKPRRIVIVRRRIKDRPKATGQQPQLYKDDEEMNRYRYAAYITNLTLSVADVWRLYRVRADVENRIKELKYDFGFESFNPDNFFRTEAVLGIAILAYNLMALFRQFILNSNVQDPLSTLRFRTFAVGVYFERA
jgi:IS4 transposase